MKTNHKIKLSSLFISLGSILLNNSAYALGYTLTDLGTFGPSPSGSYATAINNNGQVLASSEFPFLWENGNSTYAGYAAGLNNNGEILQNDCSSCFSRHAWLWNPSTNSRTDLGSLGANGTALHVNDNGQVTGVKTYNENGYGYWHATFLSNGNLTDLGTLGGSNSWSTSINNSGQVVGFSTLSGNTSVSLSDGPHHAFIWDNGGMTDLGTLGNVESDAYDINDNGQVVGYSITQWGSGRGFLWSNGAMTELGIVAGLNGSYSALAINNKGQAVGVFDGNFFNHAILWNDDGTAVDLNTLIPANSGWLLTDARDINDKGQIVANAYNSHLGTRAMLLTPSTASTSVPVPAAAWLLGSGLLGLIGVARRKAA